MTKGKNYNCVICDKHFSLCRCITPDFSPEHNPEEINCYNCWEKNNRMRARAQWSKEALDIMLQNHMGHMLITKRQQNHMYIYCDGCSPHDPIFKTWSGYPSNFIVLDLVASNAAFRLLRKATVGQ